MASSIFEVGETEHDFAKCNLKLVTCTTLLFTLPQNSVGHQSLQELLNDGLWISRGNGLNVSIQIELGEIAGSHIGLDSLADSLIDNLCAAKLWPQLLLKASRIDQKTSLLRNHHRAEIALSLSYADLSNDALPQFEHPLAPSANVHDLKPPAGVPVGFLDSIKLILTFKPLALPAELLSVQIPGRKRNTQGRQYHFRCRAVRNYTGSDTSESSSSEDHQDEEGNILFLSSYPAKQDFDLEMLDSQDDNKDNLLFMNPEIKGTIPRSPPLRSQPTYQHPSSLPQLKPPPLNLDILKLIGASLRHTISGSPLATRGNKKTAPQEIRLIKSSSHPSLAEIAPCLFRPGYIQAISSRAPLLPRIAFSISAIIRRSHSRALHSRNVSPTPQACTTPRPKQPQPQYSPATSRELQPLLWRLLQSRKWPTVPLELLECTNADVFKKYERDEMMLFSSLSSSQAVYHFGGGRDTPAVDADDEDEDMLDSYPSHYNKGEEVLYEKREENDWEEDEDLFSSLEGTPFASQDMNDAGLEEEMLDDRDWDVNVRDMNMSMGLLLEEDSDFFELETKEDSLGVGSKGNDCHIGRVKFNTLDGLEDGEGGGMLF